MSAVDRKICAMSLELRCLFCAVSGARVQKSNQVPLDTSFESQFMDETHMDTRLKTLRMASFPSNHVYHTMQLSCIAKFGDTVCPPRRRILETKM